MVGERGLEPPWILLRYHLKVVRLPISPPALTDELLMNAGMIIPQTYPYKQEMLMRV